LYLPAMKIGAVVLKGEFEIHRTVTVTNALKLSFACGKVPRRERKR